MNWCGGSQTHASRSVSLKVPSAVGVGEASAGGVGGKALQGLDGQWNGWSISGSTAPSGAGDGLEPVVSSSDDSSLAGAALDGDGVGEYLSGVQPGGRRLENG